MSIAIPTRTCRAAQTRRSPRWSERAEINGKMYHTDCIEDMSAGKLAELFDFEIKENAYG